jgi:4-diphosphocytidyl-2-C-methyl-D-erythritol kinase
MSTPVQLRACAKLTRSLRVSGVRNDGYHLIDSEMVSLELHDLVTVTEGSSGIMVSGAFAQGVPTDATNLVAKALVMARRRAAVHLDKRIPNGGGLGGGSSDAAAILRWAGISDPAQAVRLGADVAFCLVGGRATVRGIGEVIEPLPFADIAYTLIVPPLHVSTPAVYQAWDELGGPHAHGNNDLEPAALLVQPELARWRARIREVAGVEPTLAGSGATWFVEGHLNDASQALPEATVVLTRTDRTHNR